MVCDWLANVRYTQCILAALEFEGKTVVDVGAGDGAYTAELAAHSGAAHVLGVEPSEKAVGELSNALEGSQKVFGLFLKSVEGL